jgi:hypothetical protein
MIRFRLLGVQAGRALAYFYFFSLLKIKAGTRICVGEISQA